MKGQSEVPAPAGRAIAMLAAALVAGGLLAGCAALVGGAMVGGTAMAVDRRTTGTQLDDQTIEVRVSSAVQATIGDRGRVVATSYNRVVLLTGEVPSEADLKALDAALRKVENVRGVVNELAVMPSATISQITDDSIVTGKVKAAIFDSKELQVASIKVVTERGIVYLMGLVTEGESNVAGNVARGVGGVKKVVKVFEIITPAELATMPFPPYSTGATPPPQPSGPGGEAAVPASASDPPASAPTK
jgi:osmotically-inducible protein OsmY